MPVRSRRRVILGCQNYQDQKWLDGDRLQYASVNVYTVAGRAPFGEIAVQRHEKFDAVFATDQPVSAIEKDYN
jgi:hypothetical protein